MSVPLDVAAELQALAAASLRDRQTIVMLNARVDELQKERQGWAAEAAAARELAGHLQTALQRSHEAETQQAR